MTAAWRIGLPLLLFTMLAGCDGGVPTEAATPVPAATGPGPPDGWRWVDGHDGELRLSLPPWLEAFDTRGAIFANEVPAGDGLQLRDFTYVGDVVEANLLAAGAHVVPGSVLNIAGGTATSLLEVVELVGDLVGRPVRLERRAAEPGDVERTGGSSRRAAQALGWSPAVRLPEGLAEQVRWHAGRVRSGALA